MEVWYVDTYHLQIFITLFNFNSIIFVSTDWSQNWLLYPGKTTLNSLFYESADEMTSKVLYCSKNFIRKFYVVNLYDEMNAGWRKTRVRAREVDIAPLLFKILYTNILGGMSSFNPNYLWVIGTTFTCFLFWFWRGLLWFGLHWCRRTFQDLVILMTQLLLM